MDDGSTDGTAAAVVRNAGLAQHGRLAWESTPDRILSGSTLPALLQTQAAIALPTVVQGIRSHPVVVLTTCMWSTYKPFRAAGMARGGRLTVKTSAKYAFGQYPCCQTSCSPS